ncbi:MAG: RelA/SpoT family protein [Candidatus Azobacteroides sp.]|nr:RelA/SpoT family protein [Candidatus Azobacteroides sp.]
MTMNVHTPGFFTPEEKKQYVSLYKKLLVSLDGAYSEKELAEVKKILRKALEQKACPTTEIEIHPLLQQLYTALIVSEEIGLKRASVIAVLLYSLTEPAGAVNHSSTFRLKLKEVRKVFGEDVETIIKGLANTNQLYQKDVAIDSENFPKLLLVLAQDVRVILILITDRLCKMRLLRHAQDEKLRIKIAKEVSSLYAPLAHKLGLYSIKSELEDTSLKYTERVIYNNIAKKLNETKQSREEYIAKFIEPVSGKLKQAGLNFEIKGRTKSIASIWNKIKKQKTDFENIYDLFAIRVILDSDPDKEKSECWQVYSIITDMYQPNPKRLKDWLSIPKSNGYESLHTTVMGPEGKWVEVQIRSRRMDEIAERGFAAHWKYKGVKSESGLDDWLTNVREILESQESSPEEVMTDFKLDLYEKEIYVFTPKGDLYKLPQGSTVLDFAYAIHSDIGNHCVGGKINGKNVPIRYLLKSSDQVTILTSPNQVPKRDWLNFVRTSKARIKIKQTIKELESKSSEYGRELIGRRFKNKKIELEESILMRLIKKLGYKNITEFYADISSEKRDVNEVIDQYQELERKEKELPETIERTAEAFMSPDPAKEISSNEDTLVIGDDIKGLDYKLAKCCHPIYGDEIFGFVSSQGGIKIHRSDCKNAPALISRFGYRVVKAKWAGKAETRYPVTLHVVGHDDIGIVTNISSIISKEKNISLRSIEVNSSDGLFQGNITVFISDTSQLKHFINMIRTVKGVKLVERINF